METLYQVMAVEGLVLSSQDSAAPASLAQLPNVRKAAYQLVETQSMSQLTGNNATTGIRLVV